MKKLAKVLAAVSAVLLLFSLLTGALYRIFNTGNAWLEKEYARLNIEAETGYPPKDAAFVLVTMMQYSIGDFEELEKVAIKENGEYVEFFNERELSHMKDVRMLTKGVLRLGLAALIIGTAMLIFAVVVLWGKGLLTFSKWFIISLAALLVIIAALGIWMAIDFDSFWKVFHIVFLDLESSTFDPATSRMIRICPAELFSDIIKRFALIAGLGLIVPVTGCVLTLAFRNKIRLGRPASLATAISSPFFIAAIILGLGCFLSLFDGLRLPYSIFVLLGSILSLVGIFLERKNKKHSESIEKED